MSKEMRKKPHPRPLPVRAGSGYTQDSPKGFYSPPYREGPGVGLLFLFFLFVPLFAFAQQWPTVNPEAKPGSRWWWLGSAVDKENLQWNMQEYAKHGIGALEITPLYGVQGNDRNNIPYLSDKWMEMLRYTQEQGRQNGIEIDMATGTGWPFGGPWVPLEESACRAVFVEQSFIGDKVENLDLRPTEERDRKNAVFHKAMLFGHNGLVKDVTDFMKDGILNWKASKEDSKLLGGKNGSKTVVVLYIKYGVMKVKRAAPGGEGLVIDHFDHKAVANYLKHIEDAFERTHTPYPHTFFNDTLFEEFYKRRGYRLEDHLLAFTHGDVKLVSDYRETLSDLLLENFTQQWTAWAHSHGAITRNQAHGSPANLIDCYAAVDIPEIEGFGLSDFGIKGLRQDPGKTRKNDSDYSMFKYAPSAAHICGKPFTSSETFTWLTEHFRTSLSQFKPDLDLMFCAGVNRMFFHGTCYSPKDDPWPGWKFYASIDMSPTNSIWRDAPEFMKYVERCQSFLQWGQPDNDFLVYLPIRDMWKKNPDKLLMQFSIHAMGKLAPEFIQTILDIDKAGFDCDYISERLLMGCKVVNGGIETAAGTRYKALIIPGSGDMPEKVRTHIEAMKAQGAKIIYGTDVNAMSAAAKPETMKTKYGLKAIRRKNPTGYHYFIANLTPQDIETDVALGVDLKRASFFNPLNGEIKPVPIALADHKIHLALRSGESIIVQTYDDAPQQQPADLLKTLVSVYHQTTKAQPQEYPLNGPWKLSFIEETPKVSQTFTLDNLQTWETLSDETRVTMGTGVYETTVNLKKKDLKDATAWKIDLGDVRESARVYINGQYIGCAWSVPYVLDCKNTLKKGKNTIRIEVTNLPANRIADLDRKGVKWRKMEEINVVDINYKKTLYDTWEPMPSGLNSKVKLIK